MQIAKEAAGTMQITEETAEMTDMKKDIADDKKGVKEVYNDRAEHVSTTCREYQKEISDRYEQVWPEENYQTVLRKASVFINRNADFLWCRVPKAASESLTTVFVNKW